MSAVISKTETWSPLQYCFVWGSLKVLNRTVGGERERKEKRKTFFHPSSGGKFLYVKVFNAGVSSAGGRGKTIKVICQSCKNEELFTGNKLSLKTSYYTCRRVWKWQKCLKTSFCNKLEHKNKGIYFIFGYLKLHFHMVHRLIYRWSGLFEKKFFSTIFFPRFGFEINAEL